MRLLRRRSHTNHSQAPNSVVVMTASFQKKVHGMPTGTPNDNGAKSDRVRLQAPNRVASQGDGNRRSTNCLIYGGIQNGACQILPGAAVFLLPRICYPKREAPVPPSSLVSITKK